MPEELPNKPLLEALFELKWAPLTSGPARGQGITPWADPQYPLYLGVLYGSIRQDFPFVEELPAMQIPDALTPGIVKTRFRATRDGWPLVQSGPGVLAINYTDSYSWSRFQPTAVRVVKSFLDAYTLGGSKPSPIFTSATLRFIDAIQTRKSEADIFEFVRKKLHTSIDLPTEIERHERVDGPISSLDFRCSLPLRAPKAKGNLRIASGLKGKIPAMICEFSVVSTAHETPQQVDDINAWLSEAHYVAEAWFFALIQGELHERFKRPRPR
jgi:uncharacterized protein (TIGR04255 family)